MTEFYFEKFHIFNQAYFSTIFFILTFLSNLKAFHDNYCLINSLFFKFIEYLNSINRKTFPIMVLKI